MVKLAISGTIAALSLFSLTTYAASQQEHIVIAPPCLIEKIPANYQTLGTTSSLTMIKTDAEGISQLMAAKLNQSHLCGGFMDITHDWNARVTQHPTFNLQTQANRFLADWKKPKRPKKVSYSIQYEQQVNPLLKQINPQAMWDNLTIFSAFKDRYANSNTGVKATVWLQKQIKKMARQYNRNDVTVYTIATPPYKQSSVVVKIGNSDEAGIVVGAHLDSVESMLDTKPGADDDGSGSVTIMEAARTILSSGMQFKKPLYFIWYAAEEEGLVGSGHVVSEFMKQHIAIDAVIHFDLTGYAYQNEPTMWLIDDYVNKDLSNYLGELINAYVKKPVQHTRCGYACSDHATWTKYGFAAAIPAESAYKNTNPYIHKNTDTMDHLSLTHMTDYAKLATAFAVELAQPIL